MPTYDGKPWQLGEFPTDPELVSSVFCSLLDYSVKHRRRHFYDVSLPVSEICHFERKDISLVNRSPNSIFRAHYEVYVGQKVYWAPAGTLNLWIAIVWMYAAIEKVHKGVYGTYDCTDAIGFVFGD